ncbi:hypothetical protein B0H67DRAFT_493035 [Lasiosphaeris hirsuta]|uniref:Zn(2)-C6 fungal-type domain-containing protein n=1 Tax=Lasiosphaeris hirsuta TaxID=260670 RepID=A0AA40AA29_9PEZI|nr:hypothetical protein B0H67DRAFT_493035 [Lasiosphaeris hirsuta]
MQPQQSLSVARRRNRLPLSCEGCRTRKLKCNREKPCQNCTARGEQSACSFRGAKNGAESGPSGDVNDGRATQQRLDRLEHLVKKLLAERQQPPLSPAGKEALPIPATTESDTGVAGAGKTVLDGVHSVYSSEDDWRAVLQEIDELKSSWGQENSRAPAEPALSHSVDGSSLLFNQVKPIEHTEILSSLPPRPELDGLISQFFDTQNFPITIPPILHEPTFRREYQEHWRDPSRTNLIWLGLLFSMLGITMLAHHQYGEPPEYQGLSASLFQLYRMRTAQCLLSGDMAKCLPYTLETLRFNATAELARKDDNRRGLWITTGVMVRAAINMGYHRDPSHLSPPIPALQAEYRRRVWLSVIGMDDMAAFFSGLPRTSAPSDTQDPRNLHDWELSSDPLPPSRPLTEPTRVTYLLVKTRLFGALARIADLHNSPTPTPYAAVLATDAALRAAYEAIPPAMADPASFVGLSLLGIYHRGVCTLHRPFLAAAREDARFRPSRERCVASALALVGLQERIAPAWYAVSMTRQMLALAAMVLFLEMEVARRGGQEGDAGSEGILEALEVSCRYWAEAVDVGDEAVKIHGFLVGMLRGVRGGGEAAGEAGDESVDVVSGGSVEDLSFQPSEGMTLECDWVSCVSDQKIFGVEGSLTGGRLRGMLSLKTWRAVMRLVLCTEPAREFGGRIFRAVLPARPSVMMVGIYTWGAWVCRVCACIGQA